AGRWARVDERVRGGGEIATGHRGQDDRGLRRVDQGEGGDRAGIDGGELEVGGVAGGRDELGPVRGRGDDVRDRPADDHRDDEDRELGLESVELAHKMPDTSVW